LTAGDEDRLFVMSKHDRLEVALAARADDLLDADGTDGDHVRKLASAVDRIASPLLAVARTDLAKLTFLDGIHWERRGPTTSVAAGSMTSR
jgi:hypothetical protein